MRSPDHIPRANVLGVGVSALNLDSATQAIESAAASRIKGYVCVTGVHGVSEAQSDPAFRQILNHSLLNTPDGMPMVWMGRLQGFREMERVYGPDLMLRICEMSAQKGFTQFFYGGPEGVAELLARRLAERYPGLKVAGTYSPPFRPLTLEESRSLIAKVKACRPDIFWVGLSTPKQEKFMAENFQSLDSTVFIGVGAAFDFHTGRVRQAPRWVQRSGLEWLFRLLCEPRRLWRRYLKNNPLFLWRAFLQLTGLRPYRLPLLDAPSRQS